MDRTSITYRQLYYWTKVGYLQPLEQHPGSGFPLEYPESEIDVVRQMTILVKAGLTPEAANTVARGLPLPGGVQVIIPPAAS